MRFFFRLFSSRKPTEENTLAEVVKKLTGFSPVTLSLYSLAFRHRSAASLNNQLQSNERLEFLGDAILSAVVAEHLYNQYPNKDEGYLTSMRSKIVSRNNLNEIAVRLQIESLIIANLDKRKTAKSINGDTLEALIGAIYLDLGIAAVSSFIKTHILNQQNGFIALENHVISYKSKLIEWSQKERKTISFVFLNSWGLDHNKTFEMGILLNEKLICSGVGLSKKLAEEEASRAAFEELHQKI